MAVDETGHRAQALAVDHAEPFCARRRTGRDDCNAAAAHDDVAVVDDLAVADDDADVGDGRVLRRLLGDTGFVGRRRRWSDRSRRRRKLRSAAATAASAATTRTAAWSSASLS